MLIDESLSSHRFDDVRKLPQAYSFFSDHSVRPCRSPNEQRMVAVGQSRYRYLSMK